MVRWTTLGKMLLYAAAMLLVVQRSAWAQAVPTLSVDAGAGRHAINPNIYGIVGYGLDATFAEQIQVPNVRWGGDGTTRYNWLVDSSNAGADWYFMGGNGESNPVPGASADQYVQTFQPAGARALMTIPILPYLNKSAAWNCSFPVSVYGAQQSTNPYVHPNGDSCGNGVTAAGATITDTNILANHVANSVSLQQGWVDHLVARFGTAAKGGVLFYQLDNEPGGWGNTHRDVEPGGSPYSTIVSLGQQYAAMVKQQDPSALVMGPSDFTLGGWIGNPGQQGGLFAGQYYLQQMAAYQAQQGQRLLDYFDEHYYPQFTDATSQLASTRTLWDPAFNGGTWVEQYEFNGPMQLIPRFQQWISQYYPGTKLSFSEYSIDSGNKLVTDALAEADVLGIFGRQQVDFANMWSPPAPTDPIAYAFRLYRNYDGQGSHFGDTSVTASSTNQGELSIYGAQRSSDGALTVLVINKTAAAIDTTLSFANYNTGGSAAVYSYSGANLSAISALGNVSLAPGGLVYNYPAYSATLLVLKGSPASQQPLPNGTYVLTNQSSQLVLDDPNLAHTSGVQMIEWNLNGGPNQKWTFLFGNGYYTVQNGASGLYLTDPNGASSPGTPLQQQAAETSDAQLWSLTAAGTSWVLHNKATGLVIDDPNYNKNPGTGIILWPQNGGINQSWSIH